MSQQTAAKTPEQQQPPVVSGALASSPQSAQSDSLITLQQVAGNRVMSKWLQSALRPPADATPESSLGHVVQRKSNEPSQDPAEQQADRAAEEAVKQPGAARKSLIVDDEVATLQPGQMRKTEFLSALRTSVCTAAEEALAGTMWSAMGCPYIDRWLGHYEKQSSQHLERALLKYAPESSSAKDAGEYIPIVTRRLKTGIEQWKNTGEVTGVPEEFSSEGMPGVTAGGLIGNLVGGALSSIGSAVSGLASGAVGALGRISFKEREGGSIEPDDPTAIKSQLGSGHTLDTGLKSQMESAYGADFSRVRIHTDGKAQELSDNLNARAFTIGTDIAFGADEYHPGTVIGDALIAHELAHVVQQGGETSAAPQTKGGPASNGLEHDADVAAAGAVISVWGGEGVRPHTIQPKARPRRRSGLQLQRCGGTKQEVKSPEKTKALSPEDAARARFRSAKLAAREENLKEAGTSLRELGTWVAAEQKKQNRPEITAVVGLDPKHRENARKAATILKAIGPTFETKGLDAVSSKLGDAVKNAKSAKKYIGSDDQLHQMEMRRDLGAAGDSLDEAVAALEKLNDSVDGYELWKEIESARAFLVTARGGGDDAFDAIEAFDAKIKEVRTKIREIERQYEKYPKSIARIAFVVQYFVALNSPGFSGLPTADEAKKFKGTLEGNLNSDFELVFGGGGLHSPFQIFISYADVLEKQLGVLDKMSTAGKAAKTPVPAQGEAEALFKSLAKKSNKEVRDAYEQYADAYFYHRIVTTIQDMEVKGVEDLFKRDVSIAGMRPLVCSGYAILGAHLLKLAGGKVTKFITAVRATDDDIRNNRIDSGHAVAVISRGGKKLFVSNDSIFDTEKEAFDVAWGNPSAPMHKASGPTNAASLAALKAQLAKKMEKLDKKR